VSLPDNLLAGPPPTLLPADPQPVAELESGRSVAEVAAAHPASSLPWAVLAEQSLRWTNSGAASPASSGDAGQPASPASPGGAGRTSEDVQAYAYARTGYHRGLDALRRAGWRGHGPVPWSHEPNRGFLRALAALSRAAAAIGETAEADRCRTFLADCDPAAVSALLGDDR
jgi:hypothetical protein